MSKNITTKTTIENLAAELKKKFAATNTPPLRRGEQRRRRVQERQG